MDREIDVFKMLVLFNLMYNINKILIKIFNKLFLVINKVKCYIYKFI